MSLTKQQRIELNELLLAHFDGPELTRMVRMHLDENLSAIAGGANLTDIVFNLVDWAERRGRSLDLIDAALAERGQSPELLHLRMAVAATNVQADRTASDGQQEPSQPGSAVVVDIDNSSIHGSTFNINVGGGARGTDGAPATGSGESKTERKRQLLEERQQILVDKLKAAHAQRNQTLNAVDKVTLDQVILQLEQELNAVGGELAAIDQ